MTPTTTSRLAKSFVLLAAVFCLGFFAYAQASAGSGEPQEIPSDVSCGKCGMFPAKYPQWQSQIVFSDGSMTPFDGCKCMFGFMFNMAKYDPAHQSQDIANVWVKDFNSGDWVDAKNAHYVIGSEVMGPMGKELIPFADAAAAQAFQKKNGGQLAMYDTISMGTLKPLMGGMKMNMNGSMQKDMGGGMQMGKDSGMKMNGQMNK